MVTVTASAPVPGFAPLRTAADWRDFFHRLAPLVTLVLVGFGFANGNDVTLWIGLAFGVIDPILSYTNTFDTARKVIYGVGGIAQAALLAWTAWSADQVTAVIGLALFVLTSIVGSLYTPTSTVAAVQIPVSLEGDNG